MDISFEPIFDLADSSFTQDNRGMAIRYPKEIKEPVEYLLDKKEYTSTESAIKNQIRLSKRLHKFEGIVGSAIDAQIELGITEIELQSTGNKELDEILNHWINHINSGVNHIVPGINALSHKIASEDFLCGNGFPFEYWGKMTFKNKEYYAPKFIYLLDPENIILPQRTQVIMNEEIYYVKNSNSMNILSGDGRTNPDSALFKRAVKPSDVKKFAERQHNYNGFKLNPRFITHIKRKSQDYEMWGIPYLTKAFAPIASLHRLRRLDESTLEGLINLITIFKIGTEERPASTSRMQSFANLFKDPKSLMWLVWAHDLEIEKAGPDKEILNLKDAFAQKYEEIFAALNIPPILLGLGSIQGKTGDSYNQMLVLSARLEHLRSRIKAYYEGVLKKIAEANDFNDIEPKLFWHDLELNKDVYFKEFVLAMYDRGLLDPEFTIKKAGFGFDSVISRFEKFKKEKIQEKTGIGIPPELPFSGGGLNTPTKNEKMGLDNKKTPTVNRKKQDQIDSNKKKTKAYILDKSKQAIGLLISGDKNSFNNIKEDICEMFNDNDSVVVSKSFAELENQYQKHKSKKITDSFISVLEEYLENIN